MGLEQPNKKIKITIRKIFPSQTSPRLNFRKNPPKELLPSALGDGLMMKK